MDNKKYNKSIKTEDFPDIFIDFYDIDSAIKKYVDEVIHPQLDYEDGLVRVPFLYASPERWASVKNNKYIKDKKGKIQYPVMVYKRTSAGKDDRIPIGNLRNTENPILTYAVRREHTRDNRHALLNKMRGEVPTIKIYNIVFPDYVKLTYEILLWTETQYHMNKLQEMIIHHSSAYWGDEKVKLTIKISDFSDTSDISIDRDRLIKSSCTMDVSGHLLADNYTKHPKIIKSPGNIKRVSFNEKIINK